MPFVGREGRERLEQVELPVGVRFPAQYEALSIVAVRGREVAGNSLGMTKAQ